MADFQTIGLKADLKTKPEASPSALNKPSVQEQIIGTSIPLNHSTSVQSPSALASKGDYQVIGTRVPLNTTPMEGVGNSSKLLKSDRAIEASNVGSIPTAKANRS